ncbi:hypothetical protein [Nonomuraea jabiensis]|uniref:Uncharacterized protein n=1 Tax=Nonomuraea jabiensis TaxID=882448 RepID=A0A7W9LCD2_9ACTN|nr:hypothetical protein [Nonomuraea jabiensis]MBB5778661.1 hypothetical protein [Nonomuraea jabiensis]
MARDKVSTTQNVGLGIQLLIVIVAIAFAFGAMNSGEMNDLGDRISDKLKSLNTTSAPADPAPSVHRGSDKPAKKKKEPRKDPSAVVCEGPPEAVTCRFANPQEDLH